MRNLVELAIDAARLAGAQILAHYQKTLDVTYKQDGSPLTNADQAAHSVIVDHLANSGIITVSEEGCDLHLDAERYWLVDPLDGTKDFLAGNGEFTVNIALIEDHRPVLGVVYAPAIDILYWGSAQLGGYIVDSDGERLFSTVSRSSVIHIAVSRFHDHPDVDIFAEDNKIKQRVAIGSALKYGLLASGDIDVFPRLVGSSEWDTAAGQAILETTGGVVLEWHTGLPLQYGKANRRNPRSLSLRHPYQYNDFKLKKYGPELL